MSRKPTITTTITRGPAAVAERRQMERQSGASKPVNPVTAHLNEMKRGSSPATKDKGRRR